MFIGSQQPYSVLNSRNLRLTSLRTPARMITSISTRFGYEFGQEGDEMNRGPDERDKSAVEEVTGKSG